MDQAWDLESSPNGDPSLWVSENLPTPEPRSFSWSCASQTWMCMKSLGILAKCRFWLGGPRFCIRNKLPSQDEMGWGCCSPRVPTAACLPFPARKQGLLGHLLLNKGQELEYLFTLALSGVQAPWAMEDVRTGRTASRPGQAARWPAVKTKTQERPSVSDQGPTPVSFLQAGTTGNEWPSVGDKDEGQGGRRVRVVVGGRFRNSVSQ